MQRVLIADDDDVLRSLVCDIFKKEGCETLEARDGQEALDVFFAHQQVDLVVLDVMMPLLNGWEVLSVLREHSEVPVMMLTALGDTRNEVQGLNQGADDYVAKPFSYEVFIARIQALLRRQRKSRQKLIEMGDIKLCQAEHRVFVRGISIALNRKEYALLQYFMSNRGVVLTREMLLNHIWGYDFSGDERTVDTHVKTLRAKLGACGVYIMTVRGSGYRFEVVSI